MQQYNIIIIDRAINQKPFTIKGYQYTITSSYIDDDEEYNENEEETSENENEDKEQIKV